MKKKTLDLKKVVSKRGNTKMDKIVEQWMLKAAIKSGDDYFEHLLNSLKGQIDDVKRNKKHWKDAVKKKTYPDGKQIRKEIIVQQIEWTVHSMDQLNKNTDKAMTAIIRLTKAFNIDL